MKKFSKLLLVVLTVALLATTVFSTLGFATNSEGENTLIGKATELGINRKVEDFTAEDVLIQDNIIPGEAYPSSSKTNTLTWIDRDANSTNKYGVLSTVDSKSGNRYLRLMFEKAYAAKAAATYKTGIGISDKQAFAENDYLIYEWDMTTETQYPTNFEALFLNTNSSAVGDKVSLFSISADGTKLIAGDKEIDLGGAGAWHHFTVVISLSATGTDYRESQGALYLDGEKIADFNPVGNKGRKYSHSLFLGYYATARDAIGENATVCIDNVVSTSVPVGYKTAGNDKLAPLFASADQVTDLKLIGSDELVYNENYELPAEPAVANTRVDGSREFYKSFADAYAAFKTGDFQWIELYESAEGAIDSPVVIKLSGNVTFTDTAAGTADAYPCLEATGADGTLYKTYTKSTETLTIRFFPGRKGTDDATTAQLEVPFGVGIIPTVPTEFAPIAYSENPESLKQVYEATDKVEIYLGGVLQSEMPLVTEAMIAAGVVVDVYPVYELKEIAFDITVTEGEKTTRLFYTQNNQFANAVKEAPDGATITLRKNVGADAKLDINGKTLSFDLGGKALYPAGDKAFVLFEVKNANVNIYSSEVGGVIYCGAGSAAQTMMTITGDTASTVRIGYANDDAKDAYAGNLTIHTPTVVKVSAQANVTVANAEIKVVAPTSVTYGIIELSGANCTNTTVNFENVNVYNTYVENNLIAYTSAVGTSNRINLTNTVVYAPAKTEADGKGMINFVGEIANATNQSVYLNNFTYYGTLSGVSVGDAGQVNLTIVGTVEATAVDKSTIRAEDALYIRNNKTINSNTLTYVAGGAFANSLNPVVGSKTPALSTYIAIGKTTDDFCKVTWFFFDGTDGIVEEYWVHGVAPEFTGTIPVSPERIGYNFEGVALDVIADGATAITIEANEYVSLELMQMMQNISIIDGMSYNIHIPTMIPITSVKIGETIITKDQMIISEDGAYYIITVGTFSLRDIATANFDFTVNLITARSTELQLASSGNVLAYFASIYEDTTLAIIEQKMVTAFLKYAQSAGDYLGVDTSAIATLLNGKNANYYTISENDFVSDTGVLRKAVKGVRMSLVEVPAFVFYLRETFSGTITIGTETITVENGMANGKNYILYTPTSYSALGKVFTLTITGTVAGAEVAGTGSFSLTNYLMGLREVEGTTPGYILDLYQFFRIAELVEEFRAEDPMPY